MKTGRPCGPGTTCVTTSTDYASEACISSRLAYIARVTMNMLPPSSTHNIDVKGPRSTIRWANKAHLLKGASMKDGSCLEEPPRITVESFPFNLHPRSPALDIHSGCAVQLLSLIRTIHGVFRLMQVKFTGTRGHIPHSTTRQKKWAIRVLLLLE